MEEWALPEIDLTQCDQCGACVQSCPTQAVEMSQDGPRIVRPEECNYCTVCEAICPQGAITCRFEIVWGSDTSAGQ